MAKMKLNIMYFLITFINQNKFQKQFELKKV